MVGAGLHRPQDHRGRGEVCRGRAPLGVSERFDVVVAGGGPGGGAAAIALARAGHSVALVERSNYDPHPPPACFPPGGRLNSLKRTSSSTPTDTAGTSRAIVSTRCWRNAPKSRARGSIAGLT
ncbi:MAG: FAD-dependent oxidoreductase [Chloroflexi bacterium]|nr:FAD-dependent oxidoreductase [Chloroflexota bacterium]